MNTGSIWKKELTPPQFAPLAKDASTDVLIVGGGIAGLLCAYMLKSEGVDCLLLEADRICGGITQNTTAKITLQHGFIYDHLIQTFGVSGAKRYLNANRAAVEKYRLLCADIDCDFENTDSFVYSCKADGRTEAEAAALNKLGCPCEIAYDLALPLSGIRAVKVPRQAQFHPLKFAYAIARDLPIHEHTKVLSLAPGRAITKNGTVSANKIIIATHFPILNKHGGYYLKLYQHRSYVLALENADLPHGMYVDENDNGMSFRRYKNLLLLGGGGHRTGKKGGAWQELSDFAKRNYPNAREVARFATQDCMSLDRMPYIGQYAKATPDLFVITGFHKWGMTSSMVGAAILCDLVTGKKNPYASLFSPSRSMLHGQLALNALHSAIGILTPTVPRCPHLGCALKYNKAEHSWDCPCHGSRFDETGNLIDNPATDDKKLN